MMKVILLDNKIRVNLLQQWCYRIVIAVSFVILFVVAVKQYHGQGQAYADKATTTEDNVLAHTVPISNAHRQRKEQLNDTVETQASVLDEINVLKKIVLDTESELSQIKKELTANSHARESMVTKNKSQFKRSNEHHMPSDLEVLLLQWNTLWLEGNKSHAMKNILLFQRQYSEFSESIYQQILDDQFYDKFLDYREKDIVTINGLL